MHPLVAALLGAVEGLTEFLPVSSTAHLILTGRLLSLPQTEFLKTFEVAVQLGAILAVIVLYWKKLLTDRALLLRILVAFLPTAVIGLLLHGLVKSVLLESVSTVLWALLLGGVALIAFDRLHPKGRGAETLTLKQAFLVGVCQSLAIIPGVSRSAATIVGGQLLGVERKAIVEFSFLLAIPTIAAAAFLDLAKSADRIAGTEWLALGIGFAVAFVVAMAAIRWFLAFISTRSFTVFGVYRIGLAAVCALLLL